MSVISNHNYGFFSCCSVKLENIVNYINLNSKIPDYVDSSSQFGWYKKNQEIDITYEYFLHYDRDITINYPINYNHQYQYNNYSDLDYNNIIPLVKKYFSPSKTITNIIGNLEEKYHLVYDNICVLFYRGNDKITETKLCNYDEYLNCANSIMKSNPNILFLIQSDETEFIEFMSEKFPNNSFYFKDEIRHINKCESTVDKIMKDTNYEFSKYYLAITIIMSKCKYIICGSGNCSIWIMLYRENNNNVYQNLNGIWTTKQTKINHDDLDWEFIANENETTRLAFGKHIRYGEQNSWIENINMYDCFEVSNSHFNGDPLPYVKKILQLCTKCISE
jgi:hypothetical protein